MKNTVQFQYIPKAIYKFTPSCSTSASTTTAEHLSHGCLTILNVSPSDGKDGSGEADVIENNNGWFREEY